MSRVVPASSDDGFPVLLVVGRGGIARTVRPLQFGGVGDLGQAVLGEQFIERLAQQHLDDGVGVGGKALELAPELGRASAQCPERRGRRSCDARQQTWPASTWGSVRVGKSTFHRVDLLAF